MATKKAYNHASPDTPHRLRQVRLQMGLTLEEATEKIGWKDWQRLQRYETGSRKLTVENLKIIADGYGVPAASILVDGDGVSPEEREMLDWMRSHPRDMAVLKSTYRGLRESSAAEYENNGPT